MAKRVFFSFHYQDVIDFRANVCGTTGLLSPIEKMQAFLMLQSGKKLKEQAPWR